MGLTDPADDRPISNARHLWEENRGQKLPATAGTIRPSAVGDDAHPLELAPVESAQVKTELPPADDAPASHSKSVPDRSGRIESARDFPVWSRYRESGPAVFRVLLTAGLTCIFAWIFADWNTIHVAAWIMLVGSAVAVGMAYPLIVGLERPVRSSPERLLRDYFESIEHHAPLYARMWLLLTPEARQTDHYAEFSGFRRYWKGRIREWRHRGNAWPGTPVVITIGPISARTDPAEPLVRHLKFRIAVSIRGRRAAGPVANYEMSWTAERGRDAQWYLRRADPPD